MHACACRTARWLASSSTYHTRAIRHLRCSQWDLVTASPVLHGCKLVAALLAAGAQPENLARVEDDYDWEDVHAGEGGPRTVSLPEGLVQLPAPRVTLYVPSWALGTLR